MRNRSRQLVAAGLALVLAGCGGQGASQLSPTAASTAATPNVSGSPVETAPPASADPGPTLDPGWVDRPAYTCGDEVLFPPEALGVPAGAEQGTDEAAATLRAFIQHERTPESPFPFQGWRRVVDTAEKVLFVAVGPGEPRWFQIGFMRTSSGWEPDVSGTCDMHVILPDKTVTVADWWVDPAHPVGPDSTSVRAFVVERACASGHDAKGRIPAPIVRVEADSIVVIIGVRHRPGGQDCQGNPATPFTFTLPEPLGERPLLDGGSVPPREPVPTQ